MDSFAVSLAVGLSYKELRWVAVVRAMIFFGVFQAAFAGLGWLLGQSLKELIGHVDHWIAFFLLIAIGGKMIRDSIRLKPGERSFNIEKYLILAGLSVATSIDALIVGMSLGFLQVPVVTSVVVIGAITMLFTASGFILGIKNGFRLLGKRAGLLGGIILIAIGIKILVQHLS